MAGYSYPYYKKEVAEYLKALYNEGATALDIGAGGGTYYDLLGTHYLMDAVEVFGPTIIEAKLEDKYNKVYCSDVRTFTFEKKYDLIIMGDVLEHMSVEDALRLIKICKFNCKTIMVAIPYCLPQGILENNEYEIHVQDDLTDKLFNERYKGFRRIYGNNLYGYYVCDGDIR